MSSPQKIVRSVKDIRTRTNLFNKVFVPHKAYMAIASLEMDQFRRETERKRLLGWLNDIEERLKIIEKEKAVLLRRLDDEKTGKSVQNSIQPSLPLKSTPPGGRAGEFRYKY